MYRPSLLLILVSILFRPEAFSQKKLRVAVAANYFQTAREMAGSFENDTETAVEIITASSGKIASQVLHGAPFDMFFSADTGYPTHLYINNKCMEPVNYAQGLMVFWSQTEVQDSLGKYLEDLPDHSLAIANPMLAPYGKKAAEWLDQIAEAPLDNKLVTAENIGQVNQYIYSKTVSAAITAVSANKSPALSRTGFWRPLPTEFAINQSACIVKKSKQKKEALSFLNYVLSAKGQAIQAKFGYLSPN